VWIPTSRKSPSCLALLRIWARKNIRGEKISQQIYMYGWLLAIKETEHFVWHIYYGWVHHASTGITNKGFRVLKTKS
jgi:hypothetical protein